MPLQPGEGERRAQSGYVPQYRLGARLILEALASGQLRWIGLADRGAGSFDDIVLGLIDRISAYQVKSSRRPEPFSVRTLLLGAQDLLGRILEARRNLQASFPGTTIETIYVCDDHPRADDNLGGPETSVSSAAFLRAHEAHRLSWRLTQWHASDFGPFICDVQTQSGLSNEDFEFAWRNTIFVTGVRGPMLGLSSPTFWDERRLSELAAILPNLVADRGNRDRWSVPELLERLRWHDPFSLRHQHSFPIDALYQSNGPTYDKLCRTLSEITAGYVSLVGPPGSGKSTLLAAGLLPTPRAYVLRYLAFVPGEGQGLGRGEAYDFMHDIVTQLKQQYLGPHIIPGTELSELRAQFSALLKAAGDRFSAEAVRTIVVIDGLDHVPREERPQHSFLRELPSPQVIPEGVVFLLGTQRLDLTDVPSSVADQAREDDRCITIAPLTREAVDRLSDLAGVPADVDRMQLYSRTDGHPLSVRYAIDALLDLPDADEREEWLKNGPAYGGDINVFYQRAWHDLEGNEHALRGIAYVALAEGRIKPIALDLMIGSAATDALWKSAGHLLVRDRTGGWSVFHNSFRLYLRDKASLRHGLPDAMGVRRRYLDLAEMAQRAGADDPQRWMELRYLARANENHAIAEIATAELFRKQFIEGRNPRDIVADINSSFSAAKVLHLPKLVLELILALKEISIRTEAFNDDYLNALLDVGDLEAARGLVEGDTVDITVSQRFDLVTAYLNVGDLAEARRVFDAIEPINKLLGAELIDLHFEGSTDIEAWAELSLAFREPNQVLTCLARLRASEGPFSTDAHVGDFRTKLQLLAARGQIFRNPELRVEPLTQSLNIGAEHVHVVTYFALVAAYETDSHDLAVHRLEALVGYANKLADELCRESSRIAMSLGRLDLARSFMEEVDVPTLRPLRDFYRNDQVIHVVRQVILHARLASQIGLISPPAEKPDAELLAFYQAKLERIGQLFGDGLANRPARQHVIAELTATLDFLQRAEGERKHDAQRWRVDMTIGETIAAMVDAASSFGLDSLDRFTTVVDSLLENNPGRLGSSSVRRAYATAVFRRNQNAELAERRVAYMPGSADTPAEEFREAALTASAFALFGLEAKARQILANVHAEAVGYARPAKKEPQYQLWREILKRANAENPAGRLARVRFFGRLLSGLAKTEGRGAAARLAPSFLEEAAQGGCTCACSAMELIDHLGLSSWSDIVSALALGIAKAEPRLGSVAALLFGLTSLPFSDKVNADILPELIRNSPAEQLKHLVSRAVGYLQTYASAEQRILALEAVVTAASQRGVNDGREALVRWRTELPPPKSGNTPEDPFFLLRSLEEIAATLEITQDSLSSYGAASAFALVAPVSNYSSAKSLFDAQPKLNNDEESIEVMCRLAIANNRVADAEELISKLKTLSEQHGSWSGGFRSKAKQQYYALRVAMGESGAHRVAFDAFVEDLANRRENLDYLLLELAPLLELTSPELSWSDSWAVLEAHLSCFREYRRAQVFEFSTEVCSAREPIVAEILFRAIETTSMPLAVMARTAAIDTVTQLNTPGVLAELLPRLMKAGNYPALEGAQILWECRSAESIRAAAAPALALMLKSEDVAVRRIGETISTEWGSPITAREEELSPVYTMAFPENAEFERFEPPSGFSATSEGLYAEDLSTWTWVLEVPLRITSTASQIPLATLRWRVFQVMSRLGGTSAFGPEAVNRQQAALRRLELHTSFRKLLNLAAFQAMREVVGELDRAKAIPQDVVQDIIVESGGFSPIVLTLRPAVRPRGVSTPNFKSELAGEKDEDWLTAVAEDLDRPQIEGRIILAATAVHERSAHGKEWIVEQYFGPDVGSDPPRLLLQLYSLPRVFIGDRPKLFAPPTVRGGVLHPLPQLGGSIGSFMTMVSPLVAKRLGWNGVAEHVFTYVDSTGTVISDLMYWTDGVVPSGNLQESVSRHGYLLFVRRDQGPSITPHVADSYVARAWRRVKDAGGKKSLAANASRKETPPS